MTPKIKLLPLLIFFALMTSISTSAINRNIPIVDFIPVDAQRIACGCGWTVYSQNNQDYSSTLYIVKNRTGERYRLLRTQGDGVAATKISIIDKHRNINISEGHIKKVDEVFVLSYNKILLSGALDSQPIFNFVLDLDTYTATHIPAYGNYIQVVSQGGKNYLEFYNYDNVNSNGGKQVRYRALYSIDGTFISRSRHKDPQGGDESIVFYMWDKGDLNTHNEESLFGHSFVHIPGLGYVEYGGMVKEDSKTYERATDSCRIAISAEQLQAVYKEFRKWQQFTPDYALMRHDCTSFVLDIADAAKIEYGTRIEVQWPSYFMKKLKKYNYDASINANILKVKEIPSGAELMAEGYGWRVYSLITEPGEEEEICSASVIYLKNVNNDNAYLLLRTWGSKQVGSNIHISTKNEFALKIYAVSEAVVLSSDKILLSGVPDNRNLYCYIIDLKTYTAVHIPAYESFIRPVMQEGKMYLLFTSYGYRSEGGRVSYEVLYDIDGNFIKRGEDYY